MFAEGCQKGQKAINADHLYVYLIISWISPDRPTDEQINRQTDTNIYTINTVAHHNIIIIHRLVHYLF